MKHSQSPTPGSSYTGHVKNGFVIPDAEIPLPEGQAARIEPIDPGAESNPDAQRSDRVRRLQELFAEWTREDAQLSDEDADLLQKALEQQRGLDFHSPTVD
jgi:hypothetical protein